jgi:hypothetical protein
MNRCQRRLGPDLGNLYTIPRYVLLPRGELVNMMGDPTGRPSSPRLPLLPFQASCATVCRPGFPFCNPDSLMEVWAGPLQEWYEELAKIEILNGKLGPMAKSLAAVGAMLRPGIPRTQGL